MSRLITLILRQLSGWKIFVDQCVTALFITHDRSFLDRVCTRLLMDQNFRAFPVALVSIKARKEQLLHEENLANARADKLLKKKMDSQG